MASSPLSNAAAVPHTPAPAVSRRDVEASNRMHAIATPTTAPSPSPSTSSSPTPRGIGIRRPMRYAVLAVTTAALALSSGVVSTFTSATSHTFMGADSHEAAAAVAVAAAAEVSADVSADASADTETDVASRRRLGFFDSVYSAIAPGSGESSNSAMNKLSGSGIMRGEPADPLDRYVNQIRRMNEILAGNPEWVDLLNPTARKHMRSYADKLHKLPELDIHIPMNHMAPAGVNGLFTEYYRKIGVGGLMFAPTIYYHMDLQLFGHNIGMVVADAVNETSLPNTLAVLGTHTTDWRAGIHGVVWGYIHKSHFASTDEQWAFVRSDKACGAFLERNTYFYTSCLHGFGHGLYQVYKDNLEGAIEVCSHVKDDHNGEDASQCATGVYMEYSAGVSRYPLTTEICTSSAFPRACWLRAWVGRVPAMRSMGPKDDLCHDVSGETAHSDCVYGLAKAAYGFFLQSGNSNPLEELCGRYKGEAAIMCIYGSMSMQARSIEGAAAPEERASPQRIRQKETWCRQQFAVLPSDEFDHNNFNHMKAKACVVGVRSLHTLGDMQNIAWDSKANLGAW